MSTQNNPSLSSHDVTQEDMIDLRFLFGLLKAHKWFILIVIAVCVLLGGIYAAACPAIYESKALIKVEGSASNAANIAALLGVTGGASLGGVASASPADIETSLIQSDYIMGAVVEQLGMNISVTPKYFPVIGYVFAKLFPKIVNKNTFIQIDTFTVPQTLESFPFQLVIVNKAGDYVLFSPDDKKILTGKLGQLATSQDKTISIFIKALKAAQRDTFVVEKQPTGTVVLGLLNNLTIKEQGEKTGILEIDYKSQDPEASQKVLNAILKVAVEKNIMEKAEEATKALTFLQDQLPNVTQDLDTAEKRLNTYRAKTGSVDDTVEAQILLDEIVEIEKNINDLSLKKLELLENFTSKHPFILAINQKQAQLEKQLTKVKAQLRKVPLTTQETMNLERDIKVHGEIYSSVMQNMQQMQMLKGSTVSSVRVLKTASFPVVPIPSKMPLILFISLALGASLSTSLLLLQYSLSKTLDPLVLEKILGLQVLSVIPYSPSQTKLFKEMRDKKTQRNNYLLCQDKPKDVSIEALRSLRTALKLSTLAEDKKIIAISGCSPNVGKSFVSSNLVSLLSDLGEKILLIDADMRKGYLHKIFACQQSPGLSEHLQNNMALEKSIQKVLPNVDLLTSGAYPSHPSELLTHHRFAEFIEEVSQHYDVILIDTPPVLAVTDASLIFKLADIKLLMVGSGKDQLREIEHTKGVLEKSGITLDGIIYNNLQQGEKKYGYGGHYNYYNYNYQYE